MSYGYKIWNKGLSFDSEIVSSGVGKNKIPEPKERSLWLDYLDKFKDPIIIILCVILLLSCGVTGYEIYQTSNLKLLFEPAGILMAILLSTGIGFWFEVRANKEFKLLNKVKDERPVKVVRKKTIKSRPQLISIKKSDVVVGDLVKLESGDEVPADGYIIDSDHLKIDESSFTGEQYANKHVASDEANSGAYPSDFLLRSSVVLEGSCYYVVSAIGVETEEGKGALKLQEEEGVQTPLNRQLEHLSGFLTKASYAVAALIILGRLIYYFAVYHGNNLGALSIIEFILSSIMIAVTLIVVAVPEGLPMSVNVSLALSMKKMLKEKNLVRRMHACETMGATTVICTDKTGTLTQNRMSVSESFFNCEADLLIKSIAVNSSAELNYSDDGSSVGVGNPTEIALLRWVHDKYGVDYSDIRSQFSVVSQVPFSTEIKYMSTSVNDRDGHVIRFIKGAPEIVLNMCDGDYQTMRDRLAEYQSKAMRTLGFAIQEIDNDVEGPVSFIGIVGIADPVRDGVREAISTCSKQAGVRVIMVTGDVSATAIEIGKQAGLIDDEESSVLTGNEFETLSDEEVMMILPSLKILSRAKPEDKARLVELLQRQGEVVAVTGDGTNDALALKKAQVGLSMGDGTSIAKEVSDITIIDNSFSSINKAILWGRSLYLNIKRFIVFQMTINVCACLVVLLGAFTGLDSPLTVTQMLWVNLIMDTFAAMALSSLPADPNVMNAKPRRPDSRIIDKDMTKSIILSGVVFFGLLAGFWQFLWHANISSFSDLSSIESVKTFFSGLFSMERKSPHLSDYELGLFFTVFVIMQFWNLFNARYLKTNRSLLIDIKDILTGRMKPSQCFSSGFVLIAAVIVIGQYLIVNLASDFFDVAPLPGKDWLTILIFTLPVLVVPDLVRTIRVHFCHGKSTRMLEKNC